jgi:hypothetical protein
VLSWLVLAGLIITVCMLGQTLCLLMKMRIRVIELYAQQFNWTAISGEDNV